MNKKIAKALLVTLVLSAAMFMLAACGGSDSAYVGTWKAVKFEAYGVEMTPEEADLTFTVELTANGKAKATTNGEDDGEGSWEETDDGITITDSTDQEISAVLEDDQLVMEMSGITFYLEKE